MPREKPAEASLHWKPIAHTALGLGIEPGDALVQSEGSTATLLLSVIPVKFLIYRYVKSCKISLLNSALPLAA